MKQSYRGRGQGSGIVLSSQRGRTGEGHDQSHTGLSFSMTARRERGAGGNHHCRVWWRWGDGRCGGGISATGAVFWEAVVGAVGVLVRQCSERDIHGRQPGSSGDSVRLRETSSRLTAWGLTASPTASGGPLEGAAHALSFGDYAQGLFLAAAPGCLTWWRSLG